MESLKQGFKPGYRLTTNLDQLGIRTDRVSRTPLNDQELQFCEKRRKFQPPVQKTRGRPIQLEWNCSFCHKKCGVKSDVLKHWNEVHFTDK